MSLQSRWLTAARYTRVVAVHKWAIWAAGLEVNRKLEPAGVRVSRRRLLLHDASKLSRAEFMPYAEHFCGAPRGQPGPAFERAWAHHCAHNDHHPEHFLGADGALGPMPAPAVLEMVVDWMAATRAYEGQWPCCGGHWRWVEHAWDTLALHPMNKALAGAVLCALGYAPSVPQFDWEHALQAAPGQRTQLLSLQRLAESTPQGAFPFAPARPA